MMKQRLQGRDIQIFGGLFILVGAIDLIIIVLYPSYPFKLFGVAVTGPFSLLVKMHSPLVHLLIGYGFLSFRPWAWGLALAYAGFGIVSESLNQVVFGYHVLRTGFIGVTLLFAGYLLWRQELFTDTDDKPQKVTSIPQGLP